MEKAQQDTYISITKTGEYFTLLLQTFFFFFFFCIFQAKIVDMMNVIPKIIKQNRSLTKYLVTNLVQTSSTANTSIFLFPYRHCVSPIYVSKDIKFKDMKNKSCHILGNVVLDSLITE